MDLDGLPSLRAAEAVGVFFTALVSIATYLFVGGGLAVEATPTMGATIDTLGWTAFAAGRILVVAAVYAVLRSLARHDGQEWALVAGWFMAGGLVTNFLSDLWTMLAAGLRVGMPDPLPVLATILVAMLVLVRPARPFQRARRRFSTPGRSTHE